MRTHASRMSGGHGLERKSVRTLTADQVFAARQSHVPGGCWSIELS